ncbi:hypothetical protein NQ156_07850 [Microbacterium sp. zg.Y625]|nr:MULTISPECIES: hypothetical protein [unclassified Microbacterium]MCR2792970.1 hypothetical protein [Microbacterium sp. zg.Y625]MCR2814387.1 hypothetical protein [Microbacterium sp. zg.Y843]WIM24087.1 hypothetical protein QNO14_07875 [Microbacterium sp. zg-Y625]
MFYISNPALTTAFIASTSLRWPLGTAASFGAGITGRVPAAA